MNGSRYVAPNNNLAYYPLIENAFFVGLLCIFILVPFTLLL